jgi:two-component system chemotaxis sensor kinase CheA
MDDEILQEFLAESWENLGRLDSEIVALEQNPQDRELLASIFRTIHTIKGTCGFIGLAGLSAIGHSAENVLGQMRNGTLDVTPAAISLVLEAVDAIKLLLRGLEETGQEPSLDSSGLISRLDAMAAEGIAAERGDSADSPVGASEPVSSGMPPTSLSAAPWRQKTEPPDAASAASRTDQPNRNSPEQDADAARDSENAKRSVADLSIRVSVDVVDRLMNLVGELVLTRNQLLQMVRGEDESRFAAPIAHLNRVTTDLQEGVMKTRMQPIGNAWSKLPRLVRDLAQQMGKQITLHMQGADTELDRTVLDAIKDPLTHMVRNSADHGIEHPHVRRAAGKPETGTIRLNSYHEGGHVIICIEDDGAGISVDKVRQKAIQSGLISEREAALLSEKDTLALIFQPGFSTADQVTAVSGRGVGMDVVKTQIERIGGVIDLSTEPGQGTAIRIKIPLTLAIISALVVESGGLPFAIPQLGVVELVRLAAEDRHKIERIHRHEVFRLRHRLLPLVHLNQVLDLPGPSDAESHDVNIVVVQVGDEQFGLIVSAVYDTEEIVVKPVGQLLKSLSVYQGTTILGDGRVIMILDVAGIIAEAGGLSAHGGERDFGGDSAGDAEGEVTSLLLFETDRQARMAVPLSLVSRLEEFPRTSIERSGQRLVVQYRGNLLPLWSVHDDPPDSIADRQSVIVFSEKEQSLGLMVQRIEDILEERLVIRMPSQRPGVLGTAVVDGKATDILDIQYYLKQANPEWFLSRTAQRRRSVMVVDDSVFIRQLLATTLETAGYSVRTFDSARAALQVLERNDRFDLIISDIEMPEISGFTFAETVRKRRLSQAPLMALTSLSGTEARARRAGFDHFLTKFDAESFLAAVDALCSGREQLCEESA